MFAFSFSNKVCYTRIGCRGKPAFVTLAWLFDLTVGNEANGDSNEGGEQDGIDSGT